MAKLYFSYSAMNAGKSTLLLQASHNYRERGMPTLLMTASFDDRAGVGRIGSRIGINDAAYAFQPDDDLFAKVSTLQAERAGSVFRVPLNRPKTTTLLPELFGL